MPACTFYRAPKTAWGGLLALLKPGVLRYTVHLERLAGLQVRRFHYIWATDELLVEAQYQGFLFSIEMEWGGDLVLFAAERVPEEVFNHVCSHMKNYRTVWPGQVTRAQRRYVQIAKSAG